MDGVAKRLEVVVEEESAKYLIIFYQKEGESLYYYKPEGPEGLCVEYEVFADTGLRARLGWP